ncbi:MAG: DUF6597 domain-containing transcriptional factor [Blastocatellia bacterium]
MFFQSYTPGRPLGDFVHNIWLAETCAPPHLKERIAPTGTIELVINLADDELRIYGSSEPSFNTFSGALVSGTYSGYFVIDTQEERSVMGVHFNPGGAFPFLGVSPEELANQHVDLDTLWGRSARDLRERLCEPSAPAARFRILEEALLDHLFLPLERHPATSVALDSFEQPCAFPPVREIARRTGLSERRLIRVFAADVGLTPKLFSRIQRFQRALALTNQAKCSPDWATLALTCGYFDQSHLINDFVEFSGFSPGTYLSQLRKHGLYQRRNHLPLFA